jgi:hypothetical protein
MLYHITWLIFVSRIRHNIYDEESCERECVNTQKKREVKPK